MIKRLLKQIALRMLPDRALVALKKIHYARRLQKTSELSEPDFSIVQHLVEPGELVVDIGANIGTYTNFLSNLVGPEGRVICMEPVPTTFEILVSNIKRLRLANVTPLNCALSDQPGQVTMAIPQYDSGGVNYYEASIVTDGADTDDSMRLAVVEARTVDSILDDYHDPIPFIKCDVEGHELNCLKGARATIERFLPAWLIEISGDPEDDTSDARAVFDLMATFGYQSYWYDGEQLRPRQPGDESINYFFVTADHLQKLKAKGVLA